VAHIMGLVAGSSARRVARGGLAGRVCAAGAVQTVEQTGHVGGARRYPSGARAREGGAHTFGCTRAHLTTKSGSGLQLPHEVAARIVDDEVTCDSVNFPTTWRSCLETLW
jgi:hypothetical protein